MKEKIREKGKGAIEKYSRFLTSRPFVVLAIILIFTAFAGYHASMMGEAGTTHRQMLPEDIETIKTFDLVLDEFAGIMGGATIVVETEPRFARSEEIRDVRDPEVLKYVDLLSKRAKLIDGVIGAESAADVVKEANGGRIPSSLRSVKLLSEKNELTKQKLSNYVSEDYSMTVVRLNILEDADADEVVEGLREAINIKKPPGVSVDIAGGPMIEVTMKELAQSTMGTTSLVSFAAIIIILVAVFASVKYGLIPLLTIVFGSVWAIGTLAFMGFEITPDTSGVLAMIMGIGIDFGIQVTKRFRYEQQTLGELDPNSLQNPFRNREEAMVNTITSVFFPMCITTIAAMVGFKSLSFGKLPMMATMGTMMAVGIGFCMVAALTIVPVILILFARKEEGQIKKF